MRIADHHVNQPSGHHASPATQLAAHLAARTAMVGVIGLGYVGLPLAVALCEAGYSVTGFDIDTDRLAALAAHRSYVEAVQAETVSRLFAADRLRATADLGLLGQCDVILICVPTPLSDDGGPDLSFVIAAANAIAATLRPGQLVILESTTYPGTTREVVKPVLEQGGLRSGEAFFLGYSPEREDPGNATYTTTRIPKVISGDGPVAADLVHQFYAAAFPSLVPVSSMETAEAVKLSENIFRAVNIALSNEFKLVFGAMGIDVWDVINAAKTKPFGYMPFYPGPGPGGHCIPIDPLYLVWRARAFGAATPLTEAAMRINQVMPLRVVDSLEAALASRGQALSGACIMVVGLAYKKNISDTRDSPALPVLHNLVEKGATPVFHDPLVATLPQPHGAQPALAVKAARLDAQTVAAQDAVLIITDHDSLDYALIHRHARLIIDTRNAMAQRGLMGHHVVKA